TVESLRREYSRTSLNEAEVDSDPIRQFQAWYDDAVAAGLTDPHAMTLATATLEGRPSARVVLLPGCDERGFAFFTNYDSRNGHELAANPFATLVFYWHDLERQVRVEGRVDRVSAAESDAYFRSRPREAQLGAWASDQSAVVASRQDLEARLQELQRQFPEG